MKLGGAHDKSRPEVGSTERIDDYGRKGVTLAPQILDTSDENIMTPTVLLGPKHNFFSLTVCRLEQY